MNYSWKSLPFFVLACYLVLIFGALFLPGQWYNELNLAPWNPPSIAFPIVWPVLYIFIAVAGWLVFAHGSARLKTLWCLQLLLNGAWSWIFFGQHWVGFALFEIILLIITVAYLTWSCLMAGSKKLKLAGYLFCPYLAWLCLASTLNTYILVMN